MIRSEDGKLVGYVFVDTGRPLADYVADAKVAVARDVTLPPGVRVAWVAVPFSLVGAIGLIARAGLDAETGVVMLLYLTLAHRRARDEGRLRTRADLEEAINEGAARRIRPKLMTVLATMIGLIPVLWSTGTGADVM
jgi:Cu(I)/Ag(I) efflux system membrane protein CusA/SilA